MKIVMKNTTIQNAMLLAALAALSSDVRGDQGSAAPLPAPAVVYDWQFAGGVSPALPTASPDGAVGAQAVVAPGPAADGWITDNSILGDAQGVWDLGQSGTIDIRIPAAAGAGHGLTTVKVVQYSDGGIYSGTAKVSVAGAALMGTKSSVASSTLFGQWIVEETQWRASGSTPITSVSIAGLHDGSLIDQVEVRSSLAVSQPPVLSIRPVGENNAQVEVSWPASMSGLVLEQSGGSNGWEVVTQPVQTVGDKSSVILDLVEGARFYRLRQP
jgi:hypothetical protein